MRERDQLFIAEDANDSMFKPADGPPDEPYLIPTNPFVEATSLAES
jgi:hypothetical protein